MPDSGLRSGILQHHEHQTMASAWATLFPQFHVSKKEAFFLSEQQTCGAAERGFHQLAADETFVGGVEEISAHPPSPTTTNHQPPTANQQLAQPHYFC
jgi:hypothetical protein